MTTTKIRQIANSLAIGTVLCVLLSGRPASAEQTSFTSAQEAVDALVASIRSSDTAKIVSVLGKRGSALANSGDTVSDAAARERFLAAYDKAHELRHMADGPYILFVGTQEYPFPIPLIETSGIWKFDADGGAQEILDRRIGQNELAAIGVMRAYVDAQHEYAAEDRDGKGIQYARRLLSQDGTKDGLYWPAAVGDIESPFGPLIARARGEGYRRKAAPVPYHGYYFRVLTAQGDDAPGGARNFIINGRMIGGFALIATPAEYGNSGIVTFIVNDRGDIYQRDLGADTTQRAKAIMTYNPDREWTAVKSD